MSRNGTLLVIEPGSYIAEYVDISTAQWNGGAWSSLPYPRAAWLTAVERALAMAYPQSSSNDRQLTARTLAPFPLAQPGVR